MNILGVDPGLGSTGYGGIVVLGNKGSLREGGTIQSGASSIALEKRLATLYEGIREVLSEHGPQALALEEVYSHYDHPATAIIMGYLSPRIFDVPCWNRRHCLCWSPGSWLVRKCRR